jgi:sugar phosphate isomerase/epimerase
MRLGFLNACLMNWEPEKIVRFAHEKGFSAVEFHGGPRYQKVSWPDIAAGNVDVIRRPLEQYQITCPAIMYGALPYLDENPEKQQYAVDYLSMLLDAAHQLHVPVVSTFAGRRLSGGWRDNVKLFAEVFRPLADKAESLGVRIAFENCPMTHGFKPITNIAYAPSVWDMMFEAVPSPALGLNLDPSHLVWLGIDPVRVVHQYYERIYHVHAKDTEVIRERIQDQSILGESWWRYRLPGYGEIDWGKFFSALHEHGYQGVVSIEHEDPVWSGSEEKVIEGLLRAKAYLSPWL